MNTADEILAECALQFSANSDDCNKFVKAVCSVFFEPDLFSGPSMNADAIVADLRSSASWTSLSTSHTDAIAQAKAGKVVIAGMTSTELKSNHGHLAIIVGDDGQLSDTVTVPICYAGSLNAGARVERKRVSETFGTGPARKSKISYFAGDAQTHPKVAAVSRMVDRLRGIVVPTSVEPLAKAAAVRKGQEKKKTKTRKTKRRRAKKLRAASDRPG